jgi:hypothetical protein
MLRLVWMVFSVAWGLYHFMRFENMPEASQAEVNNVLWWAFLPYAIGRAILRESAIQRNE